MRPPDRSEPAGSSPALCLLNDMAGPTVEAQIAAQREEGLLWTDLKTGLPGKPVLDLTLEEAARIQLLLEEAGLRVACLSTSLFHEPLHRGERHFIERHLAQVPHLLRLASIFRPRFVRLLAPSQAEDRVAGDAPSLWQDYSWILVLLREAVDAAAAQGQPVTLENEWDRSILRDPEAVEDFFEALDRKDRVVFTWDIQNMWQQGPFPSLESYRRLRPYLGLIHLKGGEAAPGTDRLTWSCGLRPASWPVREIVGAALADGAAAVYCLNSSHGRPGLREASPWRDDLAYLRESFPLFRNPR